MGSFQKAPNRSGDSDIISRVRGTNPTRSITLPSVWTISAFTITWLSIHNSTYICPLGNDWRYFIRTFQCFGLALDVFIIRKISNIVQEESTVHSGRLSDLGRLSDSRKFPSSGRILGKISLLSGTTLLLIASAFLWKNPEHIPWSFYIDQHICTQLTLATILCTNWIICFVYLLHEVQAVTLIGTLCSISLFVSQSSIWPYQFSEAADSQIYLLTAACLACYASIVGLVRMERDATRSQSPLSLKRESVKILTGLTVIMGAALFSSAIILHFRIKAWGSHPVSLLMADADANAQAWIAQAGASQNLGEAILAYEKRYRIYPPPNFDKWYDFAVSSNSTIIDRFDQIHNDLLPFWGMEPAEIRRLTGHMLERPWTEIAGVRISNGTASIGPHMPPTHRWMIEGAVDMINTFVEYLPDMDLAFNINDESRVAVPWAEMEEYKLKAAATRMALNKTQAKLKTSFLPHATNLWNGSFMAPEAPYGPEDASDLFEGASFRSSFEHYGTIGCPPSSLARQHQTPNKKSPCHYCRAPHTLGGFISNWTLSGSLCHQPDLANLHGFHLSPSAFKSTHTLFPIFSQSKVPTFNDIIFPSPWNYRDKVVHDNSKDMPFAAKQDTAFWRGATSEGFSLGGTWQGMQRQRFVHLTSSTSNDTRIPILFPSLQGQSQNHNHNQNENQHKFHPLPLSHVKAATNFDVSFVGGPTRCDSIDSLSQTREFKFADSIDFQEHWQYKYLFDLDGAGFSGRFLPFIRSNSLVFRAATFRQWFDERLFAFRHFVPVDARLSDVWGLTAFFGGISSGIDGKVRGAHQREAERIATEGREWAEQVLRKADMEVYMFRLLLEWGRVVDDRRTEMGFALPSEVSLLLDK